MTRNSLVFALAFVSEVAFAQTSAIYALDATWVAEDLATSSDRDQNDVGLDYNKRCLVDDDTETLVSEDVRFVARVAGATKTNRLLLRFEATPQRVTRTIGDDAPTLVCEGDCGPELVLYDDFRDAFSPRGSGFVNTSDGPLFAGVVNLVEVDYAPGVAAPTDALGALRCPPPDLAVDRPDLAAPIDATTVLAGNGQPLVGNFPYFCPAGDTCPPSALVPWAPPRERVAIEDAYGAPFLSWLADQTDLDPCTRGVDCVDEDWYQTPVGDVVDGASLAATAPLPPAPRCDDGVLNGDETAPDCGGAVCGACLPLRVNVDASGAVVGGGNQPVISADGRFVAFATHAAIVPEDTNGFGDIYVRDLLAGTTTLVSVTSTGGIANLTSAFPAISADGRYVAFESVATNLVPDDTNDGSPIFGSDIFVRDLVAGTTERVSVSPDGAQGNGESFRPTISADGRFVAFVSAATNFLVSDANGGSHDVFVHDRQTGDLILVNVDDNGTQGNAGFRTRPMITPDGRYVAFDSNATNLVPGDTNGAIDVFIRDLTLGTTIRASLANGGGQASSQCVEPAVSADGTVVTFRSNSLLAPGATGNYAIFLRDLTAGTTELVSVSTSGEAATGDSGLSSVSGDGRRVAFLSRGSNLSHHGASFNEQNVYVRYRDTGETVRMSVGWDGSTTNGHSLNPWIATDGGSLVFSSDSSNLVPDDTNGVSDIFLVTLP